MADPRQAHVVRVYQNGDNTSDIWMDLLRLDRAKLDNRAGYQDTVHILSWQDGWDEIARAPSDSQPDNPGMNQNPARDIFTLSVHPDNASTTIDMDIIEHMKLSNKGQITKYVFANDENNDRRQADVLTVYNTDVESAKNSAPVDMSKGPVDWVDYMNALMVGAQDTSQSLQVEIPARVALLFAGGPGIIDQKPISDPTNLSANQVRNFVFKNNDVENAITQGNPP